MNPYEKLDENQVFERDERELISCLTSFETKWKIMRNKMINKRIKLPKELMMRIDPILEIPFKIFQLTEEVIKILDQEIKFRSSKELSIIQDFVSENEVYKSIKKEYGENTFNLILKKIQKKIYNAGDILIKKGYYKKNGNQIITT